MNLQKKYWNTVNSHYNPEIIIRVGHNAFLQMNDYLIK
jgi:hypothetical protein